MAACVRWCVWYDNGKKVSSAECSPESLPADGVLVIVEKKRDRTVSVHEGKDYYYWNGENWVSGYVAALEKWLRSVLPALKYGVWTRDGIFREAIEESERW